METDHFVRADQAPSLLKYPLALNGERSPKRPRYSFENAEAECIFSRIEGGFYHSPDTFLADIDSAATSLIEDIQSGDSAFDDPDSRRRAINQVNLFKQSLNKVCRHMAEQVEPGEPESKSREEACIDEGSLPMGVEVPRPAVLTLTSQTDRGPKHLYSGLQRQNKDVLVDASTSNNNPSDEFPTLDPDRFPNGITITQAMPSDFPDPPSSAKQRRTFGEVFRPHRSLKTLEPPRPSRNATRGSSLGWVNHDELSGSERLTPAYKSDYRYASLPTGSWLHYNSAEALAAWPSDAKRKQRDRALSFGESRAEPAEEIAEHEHARTKALFQSAYSSFAPSIDNSAAVVPERTRSQAWWSKVGRKRFQALLSLRYPESGLEELDSASGVVIEAEDDFEAAVADFEGEPLDNPLEDHAIGADPKEVDEVLQDISDLLQTLSSYQRIRSLSKMNSGPATATSAETDVYEILRSNLVMLVSLLPPYAVAKLSGDQIEMLNVSTNVMVDMKDHVGTMEMDEYNLHNLQRQRAAMATATHPAAGRASVSVGSAGRPGNYSVQSVNYNQRLSYSNAPRTPFTSHPRPTPAYGNTGTPQPQTYPAARPAPMTSQRPSVPVAQHYSHQTYSPGPNAAQFQRPPTAQQNGYGPGYAQTVNAQAFAQQRQSQSAYVYPPSQSPQKPIASPQPVMHAQQQYIQHQQSHQSQASPSVTYQVNHQAAITEQVRNQIQVQRQLSGTQPIPKINGQYAQTARSSTPGGGTPNGRPVVAAGSGGQ